MTSDWIERTCFRLLEPGDGDRSALAQLINAAFAVYPFLREGRTSPEGIAEEQGDSGRFLVAESDGELVACAMLRPSLDMSTEPGIEAEWSDGSTMYLGLVAVAPRVRKQGLGRRLVAAAEEAAHGLGFSRMMLGTLREMGNDHYYAGLGYRVAAEEVFEPGHWGMDIAQHFCVMVKPL